MSGIINYFKKDIKKLTVIALIVVVFVSGVIFIIGNTFAAGGYTIVFNRAEGNQVLKTCITDENGILYEDCITYIVGICHTWSEDIYNYNTQYNNYYYTDLETKVFTSNMNLYCKAGTSVGNWQNNIGCYVCIEDNSIMHWTTNGRADSKCPTYGYQRNYYISESECETKLPDACYVCSNNEDVMKWDNDGDADSNCSSGYRKDSSITTESACRPVLDACYVCKINENIMKWDNDDKADTKCPSGYRKDKSITQNQCVTITNPQTGNMLFYVLGFVGILSFAYSIYCYKFKFLNR